jgi:hypothetical protein
MSRRQAEKRKKAFAMADANDKLTDAQKLAKAKGRVASGMGESVKEIARLTKRIEDAKNQAPKKEKKESVAA